MIEVLKQSLEALEECRRDPRLKYEHPTYDKTIASLRQAIAELESQEPVAWLLTEKNINSLQVDSIQLLINRLKHAHHTDLCVRINGQDEWFQADWLKHMVRAMPPQRTEPKVCCQQYDTCLEPCTPRGVHLAQRTWVELTEQQRNDIENDFQVIVGKDVFDAIETMLKQGNT